jgi:transposase|tara:strand:- start:3845 stop:3976 length:132 start_codon:yes stop_codon:yes gene_type:complete
MATKRNQYTRKFKLEAISLVIDQKHKIPDVVDSLGIVKLTLQE